MEFYHLSRLLLTYIKMSPAVGSEILFLANNNANFDNWQWFLSLYHQDPEKYH